VRYYEKMYLSFKKQPVNTALLIALLALISLPVFANQKGLSHWSVKNDQGEKLGYYEKSVALLIAISDYTNGWPNLESVNAEIDKVEETLTQKGYEIVRINNPNTRQLKEAYASFIDKYGYEEESRLLFYYSGHGHTIEDGRKGYLVPADAPHPETNLKEFKRKALDMNQLLSWARQMDAKHGLFLFDSCFSGTIFKQRNLLPNTPPPIDEWTDRPVRQFITAGSAGETVPANSTFTPAFVDAIKGKADLNGDGYVIGTELGLYLKSEVRKYVPQTPQYGKIDDYELSRGDFVFFTNSVITQIDNAAIKKTPSGLDISVPTETTPSTGVTSQAENSVPQKKEASRPWYKNPWFWAGTFAAVASGVYIERKISDDDDSGSGTVVFE